MSYLFSKDISGSLLTPDHDVDLDSPVGLVQQNLTQISLVNVPINATKQKKA